MSKLCLFVSTLILLALTLALNASQLKEYGPIKDGDNLWAIAKQLRPSDSISVAHMTRLLFKYNPQAFISNDLNRLKTGATIRVPDHLFATTDTPEEQSNSGQPLNSETKVTKQEQTQSKRSTAVQPSVQKSVKDAQKSQKSTVTVADLQREINKLRQENATKEDEINSLRSELLALSQAGIATEQQGTATNSIPSTKFETDVDLRVSSEDTVIKPAIDKPLAETQKKQVAEDLTEQTNMNNNSLALVGLGVAVAVMVMIVGIMWRQGTIATQLLKHPGQLTDAQASNLPAGLSHQAAATPEESTEMLLTTADDQLTQGNYQQAEALLQQALNKNPSRDDIKLKLLQIYYKQQDQHNFGEYGNEPNDTRKLTTASLEKSRNINQTTESVDDRRTSNPGKAEISPDTFVYSLQQAAAGLNAERINDDQFDEVETKLELARACVDIGDLNRAQSILNEVMLEGTQTQRALASTLIMSCKNRLLNIVG